MSLDVYLTCSCCEQCFYSSKITHNLTRMADAARVYSHLWRPEEIGIERAEQLIYPLKQAIRDMQDRPNYYKRYNASNGWGLYKDFLPWIKEYWKACVRHPQAQVEVSR